MYLREESSVGSPHPGLERIQAMFQLLTIPRGYSRTIIRENGTVLHSQAICGSFEHPNELTICVATGGYVRTQPSILYHKTEWQMYRGFKYSTVDNRTAGIDFFFYKVAIGSQGPLTQCS
jgi:hypothetical protein